MEKERKSAEKALAYHLDTRVNEATFQQLTLLLKQSGCRSMSELIRKILEGKPVLVRHYDSTFDRLMETLTANQKELRAIGINVNQITRYFHASKDPQTKLFAALEIAQLFQQADQKISMLFTPIAQLSEKWLPK